MQILKPSGKKEEILDQNPIVYIVIKSTIQYHTIYREKYKGLNLTIEHRAPDSEIFFNMR